MLLECFSGTLQPDQTTRQHAEAQLKTLSQTPGFLLACLDVLQAPQDQAIKKAAALYFKNRVVRTWDKKEDERGPVQERILSVLISSDYHIKQQLIPALRKMISHSEWPGLLQETGSLLQQHPPFESGEFMLDQNLSHLYTGLLCFGEISRNFRWVENGQRAGSLYPMIETAFPHLLKIGQTLAANSERLTEFSAEILKLVLRVYKLVTSYDLPEPLQTTEAVHEWAGLHMSVVNMVPPQYVVESPLSEQEKCFLQVSKCYKWAIANMHRVFSRYAAQSLTKKFRYDEFRTTFVRDVAPAMISNYLSLIEQWCTKTRWVSLTALYYLIEFLSHCITDKSTWLHIKPYYMQIVEHLVYPLLQMSDHGLELYDEDPVEYVHAMFDYNDDSTSPEVAALALLVTLVESKSETTLEPILEFISTNLEKVNGPDLASGRHMEGLFNMLACISGYIKQPYLSQMERFLVTYVFPCLHSEHEFLKARALDVVAKFDRVEYSSKEDWGRLFHGILVNFKDDIPSSLPVHFQAAMAIQAYLSNEDFQAILATIILPTMSKLLELSNEIDSDAISVVMQECVENFSAQLQPFGIDLMSKLVEQFLKLAREIHEAANVDVDDFGGAYDDMNAKVMAATGLLNTMITVLLSFENSAEICLKLEEVFAPAIEYVFSNTIDEFYDEIGQLMENSTFMLRAISPVMWRCFALLYDQFHNKSALMYFEELSPCLHNLLNFAHELSPDLAAKFVDIFRVMHEAYDSVDELVHAFKLAQAIVLNARGSVGPFIPEFLKATLSSNEEYAKIARTLNNVVLACLVCDAPQTLAFLQEQAQIVPFFERWFTLVPQLTRVYDLKLSVLACIALLSGPLNVVDSQIQNQVPRIVPQLLAKLPAAIVDLEKRRKNFDYKEDHEEYLDFLEHEESKFDRYYDLDEEDPLASDALERVDVFKVFREFAESGSGVFGGLEEGEREILEEICSVSGANAQ